jgi:NhaP-type Na+/H+ and K+/H+ antiporter
LAVPIDFSTKMIADLRARMRGVAARLLAIFRNGERLHPTAETVMEPGDRLLVLSRSNQWETAESLGLSAESQRGASAEAVTARVVVAHGSLLIGLPHADVQIRSSVNRRGILTPVEG